MTPNSSLSLPSAEKQSELTTSLGYLVLPSTEFHCSMSTSNIWNIYSHQIFEQLGLKHTHPGFGKNPYCELFFMPLYAVGYTMLRQYGSHDSLLPSFPAWTTAKIKLYVSSLRAGVNSVQSFTWRSRCLKLLHCKFAYDCTRQGKVSSKSSWPSKMDHLRQL